MKQHLRCLFPTLNYNAFGAPLPSHPKSCCVGAVRSASSHSICSIHKHNKTFRFLCLKQSKCQTVQLPLLSYSLRYGSCSTAPFFLHEGTCAIAKARTGVKIQTYDLRGQMLDHEKMLQSSPPGGREGKTVLVVTIKWRCDDITTLHHHCCPHQHRHGDASPSQIAQHAPAYS